MKELYNMKMIPTEEGLQIWTNIFYVFHETPCYYFCLRNFERGFLSDALIKEGETVIQSLKRRKVKFKKVAKTNSRFAFVEKEDAYKQLLFMKKRQLIHLQRDLEFVKAFLRFNKDNGFSDLKGRNDNLFVPNTEDLVLEHYVFD